MFSAFEWMVAIRYLRARRAEGFISVTAWFSLIGIALGVATLIIVMAVMNGFRTEILDRILGLNGHISVLAYQDNIQDQDALAQRIAGIPGIVDVTPFVEGQVMATSAGEARGAVVRGLSVKDIREHRALAGSIVRGDLDNLNKPGTILIGIRMAQRYGLSVGDKLTLVSPNGARTAVGFVPRIATYRIGGAFEIGMFDYDSSYIYMPLELAQRYFRTDGGVTGLEVVVADADRAAGLTAAVSAALDRQYRVIDWQQANAGFANVLQVERNVMFLILTLIILVASFNIISSLIMLVKDKSRDIAILRTMGATRGAIQRIFFIAGASIGVVGALTGFVLGVVFCLNIDSIRRFLESLTGTELWSAEIRFLSQMPARMETGEVVMVLIMSLSLSLLATLYPARRAARLDPVEALRYE